MRVRDRVNAEYDGLEPGDLRIIHCDLWHANIKIHRGVLAPFDFEDTIRGYRLHDIAMSMLDLHEEVGDRRYPPLLDAFRRGYETLLGWPGGDMEVLQAGRLLWQLNYIARFERKRLSATASRLTPVLAGLERSGRILFGSDG